MASTSTKSFRELLEKKRMPPRFHRHMSLFSSTVLGMGAIMGAGIYVLVGLAAQKAGSAVWLSFLICGLLAYSSVLLYSAMAKQIQASGGGYLYAYQLLGPFWGFIAGWHLAVGSIFGCSIYAMGFGIYVSNIFIENPDIWSFRIFAVSLTIVLTGLNLAWSKEGEKLQQFLTLGNVAVLLIFALLTIPSIQLENVYPLTGKGFGGVWDAISIIYLSYFGYQLIANNSEEVIQPEKTVPKAMSLSLLISLGVYMLIVMGAVLSIPWQEMANADAPLAYVAGKNAGTFGVILITIGGILASGAALSSTLVSQSRQLYAMGRDRLLPKQMGMLHPRAGIPSLALSVGGLGVVMVLLMGNLESIARVANFCFLVSMLPISFALLKLQRIMLSEGQNVTLFQRIIPWLAFCINLVLLISTGLDTLIAGNQILLVGTVIYLAYSRVRERRSQMGKSLVLVDEDEPILNFGWAFNRRLLVPMANPQNQKALLSLCESLLVHHSSRSGSIYALTIVKTSPDARDFDAALDRSADQALKTLETGACLIGFPSLKFKPVVRISHSLVKGVTDAAREAKCNLIVMGFSENPGSKEASLMEQVLADTSSDMIFLRARGEHFQPRKIAVALGGKSENLDLMVKLASALSDRFGGEITFLSVLAENASKRDLLLARNILIKALEQNSSINTYQARSLKSSSSLGTLIELSSDFDLMIAGTTHVGFLEAPRVGPFSLQLSQKAHCSVALVSTLDMTRKWMPL